MLDTPSDADLVARALRGSREACDALVVRHAPVAVNLAARIVRDRALAEDLTQEAFVRAFARLSSYDRERKFVNWFLQIVHNVAVDHLRRRRLDTISLDQPQDAGHPGFPAVDTGSAPAAVAEQAALGRALETALAQIRPEYRAVVVLRYQEGLTHPEIAEIVGQPVGTVKTHLHRARKELAGILTGLGWAPDAEGAETLAGEKP